MTFNIQNKFEYGILYGAIRLTFWQKLRWLFGSKLNELRSPAITNQFMGDEVFTVSKVDRKNKSVTFEPYKGDDNHG